MTTNKIYPLTLAVTSVTGGTIISAHIPAILNNTAFYEAPIAPHHPEREDPQPEQRLRARAEAAVNTASYGVATSTRYVLVEGDPWVLRLRS